MSIRISKGIVKDARRCTICGQEKSLNAFSKLSSGKLGRNSQCKECRSMQRKNRNYNRQPEPRLCPRCNQIKNTIDYSRDRGNRTGLQTYCKKCQTEKRASLDGYMSSLFENLLKKAKRYDFRVEIAKEDLLEIYQNQEGLCALSGTKMTYYKGMRKYKRGVNSNISIDLKDPSKTYTLDNIQLVCRRISVAKGDMSQEEFVGMCREVTLYRRCDTYELVFHEIPNSI